MPPCGCRAAAGVPEPQAWTSAALPRCRPASLCLCGLPGRKRGSPHFLTHSLAPALALTTITSPPSFPPLQPVSSQLGAVNTGTQSPEQP